MDELMKMLIETAMKEKVRHQTEPKKTAEPKKTDLIAEAKQEAMKMAQLNRILYEAHINAGFTKEEALALTIAQI